MSNLSIDTKLIVFRDLAAALLRRSQGTATESSNIKYDWSIRTWLNIIHSIADHCYRTTDEHCTMIDCWMTTYKVTQGYYTMKITPVLNSSYSDARIIAHLTQGVDQARNTIPNKPFSKKESDGKTPIEKTGTGETIAVHRVIHALYFPGSTSLMRDKASGLTVSHICGRQLCISPYHLVVEFHKANISRKGCRFGCRKLCPHTPKCVFVTKHGSVLPCLNNDEFQDICNHSPNCYDPNNKLAIEY
jgi:hypothetical protein